MESTDADFERFTFEQHLHAMGAATLNMGTDDKFNYCPDCDTPMQVQRGQFHCAQCGHMSVFEETKDFDDIRSAGIRIATGHNKGRFFNQQQDYSKIQLKNIVDTLRTYARAYESTGRMPFSQDVINAAARQYNYIQKHIKEEVHDAEGQCVGEKKFVRRSSIMQEILAALIWFETIRAKNPRSKDDIAEFMQLNVSGFARGEDVLRDLAAEGKIELPDESDYDWGYVDRYFEALGLSENADAAKYRNFIIDIVAESERVRLGMTLQFSSKIVGAIWLLIVKKKLPITAKALEQACDNTKKNTFCKFYKLVTDNPRAFAQIFTHHQI